jgi:hypothetical protein
MPAHKALECLIKETRQWSPIMQQKGRSIVQEMTEIIGKAEKFWFPEKLGLQEKPRHDYPFMDVDWAYMHLPYTTCWFEIQMARRKTTDLYAIAYVCTNTQHGIDVSVFMAPHKDEWFLSSIGFFIARNDAYWDMEAIAPQHNGLQTVIGTVGIRQHNPDGALPPVPSTPEEVIGKVTEYSVLTLLERAILLLNVKNTTTVLVEPPVKVNKKRLKKKQPPIYRYHVLGVSTQRRVVKRSMSYAEAHSQNILPLHTVRGHLATYTKDKPLFGRPGLHGKFWISAHVRGKRSNGTVLKDYAMQQ